MTTHPNFSQRAVQSHPAYFDGFYDAADLEPLFDDAATEYRAGWQAYWECREILRASQHGGDDAAPPPARQEG